MTEVQQKYQLAVDAANKAYASGNVATVVFVDRGDTSWRRYNRTVLSYNVDRDNWQNWRKAVNAAVADYMAGAQGAYNGYMTSACWW